ncbi:hypothetical protein LOTGIDRAFT_169075 [Lottia gigantea]|uniref:SOCS box domain-containing protein n=1 Tax=Lottia gigantea TaxID=225164 RepID=V3YZI3_LOTGI|nr:hypothetical protein LOTGIDRAFT_169075 [Lottia gigantea]ESO83608.1 hypothetical protein LOTGIDRAFT_169075 [Lottia gigantea]
MQRISAYLKLRKNVFEGLRRQTKVKFGSCEELCEHIGDGLCDMIDNGTVTLQQAIEDSIQFSIVNAKDSESRYFSWLTLHMTLGLCFKYRVDDKGLVRDILVTLLPFSHGVDYGIYLRDLLEGFRQPSVSSVINLSQTSTSLSMDKSMYFLKYSAGMSINLRDEQIRKSLFDGTGRAVWAELLDREKCQFLDLPIAHAHLQPMMIHQPLTASLQVSSLLLAIMNIKPEVVLMLLRHGASAEGPPLRYLLRTLGTINIFPGGATKYSAPIVMLADCLNYCLRTLCYVHFKTEMETIGNKAAHAYYVKSDVCNFVPKWTMGGVAPLKHMARCWIRLRLIENDQLQDGIENLEIPSTLQKYLDLQC